MIEGLELALDCDRCRAFDEDRKPDLVAVHRCGKDYRWIVIEIKKRIRAGARQQIESGLRKLQSHPMFAVDIQQASAYYASQRGGLNANDVTALMRPIRFGSKPVLIDTVRCRGTIRCR